MTSPLSPVIVSRLEKAATDNGFDHQLDPDGNWLVFASTHCPLQVWLSAFGDAVLLAAFSHSNVAATLGEYGTPMTAPLPKGAVAGRTVSDVPALHRLLRRSFQLANTLPNELLHTFEKQVAALPRSTEIERLAIQRVGQNLFRDGLLDLWEGRCAVTGLAVATLLRASHIKPWAVCDTDAERLDVYNGILLAPHLDVAFDAGFITVDNDGAIIISGTLDTEARSILGLNRPLHVRGLTDSHRTYLPWHRERVFNAHLKATATSAPSSADGDVSEPVRVEEDRLPEGCNEWVTVDQADLLHKTVVQELEGNACAASEWLHEYLGFQPTQFQSPPDVPAEAPLRPRVPERA